MEYFEHQNTPATTSHVIVAQQYLWQVWLVYFGPSAVGTSCEELSCRLGEGNSALVKCISGKPISLSRSIFIL